MNSICKIQTDYIKLIESYVEPLGKEALKDHINSGNKFASMPYFSDVMLAFFEPLSDQIERFWDDNQDDLLKSIENLNGLKFCYSGDISPSNAINLISRLGLYIDTVLLPDPLLNMTRSLPGFIEEKAYLSRLVRHSLNVLKLKPLLTSDLTNPPVIIFPSKLIYDERFRVLAAKEAQKSALKYFDETFGIRIGNKINPFLKSKEFKDPKVFIEGLKKEENLIPDWTTPTIEEGLKNSVETMKNFKSPDLPIDTFGQAIFGYTFGRLLSFQEHIENCSKLNAEPLYDSPNSWKMYSWYIQSVFPRGNLLRDDTLVANSLGVKEPQWIGKLPLDKFLEARGNNELSDMRKLLTQDLNTIRKSTADDLEAVTLKVKDNLNTAFNEHAKELKDLEKKYKRRYKIGTPLLVGGSILANVPSLSNPASLGISLPFTMMGIYSEIRDKKSKKNRIEVKKNSLVGIMYESEQ